MKRRVWFGLLSSIAVLGTAVCNNTAHAATIMQETFQADGLSRSIITRTITAPAPGQYLLTLKNGSIGPRLIEQCETEDTVELKNECRFRNLNERIEQDFSRIQDALIKINSIRIRNPQAPTQKTITKARGFLIIPVTLNGGTNKVDIDLLGYSTSRLTVSLESAPSEPLPPSAAFLVNRIQGTTTTPFTLDAKESFSPNGNPLLYSWNWGDGNITSGGTRVTHSYSAAGLYTPTLTVTDQRSGLTSTFSTALNVKAVNGTVPPENEKPKPGIQWVIDSGNPLHVLFDASTSTDDGTIASYAWRITSQSGAVQTRSGIQIDYVFPEPGSYTIRLTVKDDLGAQAAIERVISLADMTGLVRDESLLGPTRYYGSAAAENKTIETLTLASPRLAVLKIKNADGLEHPIESCSSTPWPEKIACLFQNTVNRAYVALYRVNSANVYINGRRVTDGTSLNKQKAYFESVVSLSNTNSIDIRVKGWPTAFIELELQSLEVNAAPIVYVTHSEPHRGIPQLIEFDAMTSVDMNDHIMSYRFQAFKADGTPAIDTDWQGASFAALEFTESGTFTVTVSARDTFGAVGTKSIPVTIESNQLPLLTASYVVLSNQAPYQVQVTGAASDPDGDALQYNFAYSTGQISGFQDSPEGLISFAAAGTYSVDVTARDVNGGTATFTLPITVGENLLPIANFDFVTDRGGYAPLTITVDASPSSDPDDAKETLRYFWTFGDSSPRVEGKILSHTFQSQGHYVVTLSVLDPKRGLSTKSRAAFAWRTTPPNPVLIANPRIGPASLTVDFDASQSTPGASPIASYLFDYADGTFDRSLSPYISHTFTQPGIYNVGLIVYDTDGNGNIGGQTVYVFDGKKPSAAIQVVSSDVITPARFELLGSGVSPNPLATITDYKWTLPNGTVQTGASLIYTTSTNGNFAIKLEVKDSYGYWSDPATLDLSAATGTLPIAQITADKTRIALGQAVKLSGLNSYTSNGQANLVSYEWTLPNGTKIYGPEKTVTLSATGLKTISLIVTDSKGYVSQPATIQIQVDARQTPVPVISMTTSGTVVPVTALLNGLQSTTPNPGATITGYEWKIEAPDSVPPINFSLFGAEVSALLLAPYTHTISLRVFDSAGAVSGWVSKTFGPLINNNPVAVVTPSSVIAKAPATVVLSAIESTDPDGHSIINAHWLFSDGTDFQGLIATHEFSNTGTYSAIVRVQDQYGAWSDPVTVPITIIANLPPVAVITPTQDPQNKFNFTFDASASFDLDGTIARYDWFFSDGFVSLGAGPTITHAFPSAGTWRAGVNVFDNKGAMATVQVEVTVSANLPPVPKIRVVQIDHSNRTVTLSAADSTDDDGPLQFNWNWSDGSISIGTESTHTYQTDGEFEITLTATDKHLSEERVGTTVAVFKEPLQITASIQDGALTREATDGQVLALSRLPSNVEFSLRAGGQPAQTKIVNWQLESGETFSGSTFSHRFFTPEPMTITGTFTGTNGAEVSQQLTIIAAPTACYKNEDDTGCAYIVNAPKLALSESESSLQLKLIDVDLSTVSGLAVFASQGVDSSAGSDITAGITTLPPNEIRVPLSSLLANGFNPNEDYDLRVTFTDSAGNPAATSIHGLQLMRSSIHLTLASGAASILLTVEDLDRATKSLISLTDTGAALDNIAPGTYRVYGKSDSLSVDGYVSLTNGQPQSVVITPSSDIVTASSSSVVSDFQSGFSANGKLSANAMSSKLGDGTAFLQSSANGDAVCIASGQTCLYTQFGSPMRFRLNDQWAYAKNTDLGPIVPESPSSSLTYETYRRGSFSLQNEQAVRQWDPRFNFVPGEDALIECRGYTSAWGAELFPDALQRKATALDKYRDSQAANDKLIDALYNTHPFWNPSLNGVGCYIDSPDNCTPPTHQEYWDEFVAYRATVIGAINEWNRFRANEYKPHEINAGIVGKATKPPVFRGKLVLTRYNLNGTKYFDENGHEEALVKAFSYDTAMSRGSLTKEEASSDRRILHDVFHPDRPVSSKSIRIAQRIPPQWKDYRLNVVLSGPNSYKKLLDSEVSLPDYGRPDPTTKDIFACRPAERIKGAAVIGGQASFNTTMLLNSQINQSLPPGGSLWTYADNSFSHASWASLMGLSIVAQQNQLESRSIQNTTLAPFLSLSPAVLRSMSERLFEIYRTYALFSQTGEQTLFPMNFDLDTSSHRNPAYSMMMLNDDGTFSASRIATSDFDFVARLQLRTFRVKSVSGYSVFLNGSQIYQQDFAVPLLVPPGSLTVMTPEIRIPYQTIRASIPSDAGTTGSPFELSFRVRAKGLDDADLPPIDGVKIALLPVWDLKPTVTNASDVDHGLFSGKISAYGGAKLKSFIEALVAHRNSVQADPIRRYNIYINDGSLPFGGTFKPIHNTHNDGYILDMRPLGNTGSTGQHYDFASGAKRIADLAVVWAESAYRYETCKSKAEAQKIACEATAAATFKANFDADPNQEDYFDDVKGRLVQWINLNQQLGEIAPGLPSTTPRFRFSDGLKKFNELCSKMTAVYNTNSGASAPASVCLNKIDGSTTNNDDRSFQIGILKGRLPNGSSISGVSLMATFNQERLETFFNESGHYDHFHIEIKDEN